MDFVTVATFENMPHAHIAMGRLRAEGIECHLDDENIAQTTYNIAVGGIKLRVRPEDANEARRILDTDYSGELD